MATAKQLNDSYKSFEETRSEEALQHLLLVIGDHVKMKFSDRYNVEDLSQDILLKVWQSIDPTCVDPRAPFDGRSSFSTWLSMVMQGILLNDIRDSEEYESVGTGFDLSLLER